MQTIKSHARVDHDRKLSLQLHDEVSEGDVEVIVLAPERHTTADRRKHLEPLSCKLAISPSARMSKAEIDASLVQERASRER